MKRLILCMMVATIALASCNKKKNDPTPESKPITPTTLVGTTWNGTETVSDGKIEWTFTFLAAPDCVTRGVKTLTDGTQEWDHTVDRTYTYTQPNLDVAAIGSFTISGDKMTCIQGGRESLVLTKQK